MAKKKCRHCYKEKDIKKFPPSGSRGKNGQVFRLNICYPCRTLHRSQSHARWKSRAFTAKTYKCIYDPEGCYTDTTWYKGTVETTLKDGLWTPGMWWLDQETGSKYEVQGNEEWYKVEVYLAERLNLDSEEENHLKPEKQRLVRSRGKRQPPEKPRSG